MVRCSKCTKSFKQHTGESWMYGMCHKCFIKPDVPDYTPPKSQTRTLHTAFDFYMDLYVQQEILTIDN